MKNLTAVSLLIFIFFYHSLFASNEDEIKNENSNRKNYICKLVYIPDEDIQSASCTYQVMLETYWRPREPYLFRDHQRVVGIPDANRACNLARNNVFNYCQYILWQRFGGYGYCWDYHYYCFVRKHIN